MATVGNTAQSHKPYDWITLISLIFVLSVLNFCLQLLLSSGNSSFTPEEAELVGSDWALLIFYLTLIITLSCAAMYNLWRRGYHWGHVIPALVIHFAVHPVRFIHLRQWGDLNPWVYGAVTLAFAIFLLVVIYRPSRKPIPVLLLVLCFGLLIWQTLDSIYEAHHCGVEDIVNGHFIFMVCRADWLWFKSLDTRTYLEFLSLPIGLKQVYNELFAQIVFFIPLVVLPFWVIRNIFIRRTTSVLTEF